MIDFNFLPVIIDYYSPFKVIGGSTGLNETSLFINNISSALSPCLTTKNIDIFENSIINQKMGVLKFNH